MGSTMGASRHYNLEVKFRVYSTLNLSTLAASRGVLLSEYFIQFGLSARIYFSLDNYLHHSADQSGSTRGLLSYQRSSATMCLSDCINHVIGVIGEPLTE